MQEEEIKKLYYSIGEVSEITGLDQHVLRYWESEFNVLKPKKNRSGRRVYTPEDIEVVQRLYHLLKVEKYTIEGAKQVLSHSGVSPEWDDANRQALIELRSFLKQLLEKI